MRMSTLSPVTVKEILDLHGRCGIRLEHSVVFLLRTLGHDVTAVAREAGCARSLLYKALSGERSAPEELRRVVRQKIGVDPWEIHLAGEGVHD